MRAEDDRDLTSMMDVMLDQVPDDSLTGKDVWCVFVIFVWLGVLPIFCCSIGDDFLRPRKFHTTSGMMGS